MTKRIISAILALGLLVGAGALNYALAEDWGRRGSGMYHGSRGFGHGIMRMLRTLDLSDDQKEQVSSALMSARKTSIVSRAQLRVARMELHETLLKDSVNDAEVEKIKDQIKALQGDLLDSRVKVQQSISSVLTPEQRSKARTMFLERMSEKSEGQSHHGRGHRGRGHGRGHGRFHGDGEGRPRDPGYRN